MQVSVNLGVAILVGLRGTTFRNKKDKGNAIVSFGQGLTEAISVS